MAQPRLTVSAGIVPMLGVLQLVITTETTRWKTWIGFDASHSFGAILSGLLYGWLALRQADLLLASPFLMEVGLAMLGSFAVLGSSTDSAFPPGASAWR